MDASGTSGLAGSVLIYMSAIMLSMGVLAAPIYFITGPIVLTNDRAPTLTRVVTQPLVVATDDSTQPNTKAEAALNALEAGVRRPSTSTVQLYAKTHYAKTHSHDRVASNAPDRSGRGVETPTIQVFPTPQY